jgi:hypothetical protein
LKQDGNLFQNVSKIFHLIGNINLWLNEKMGYSKTAQSDPKWLKVAQNDVKSPKDSQNDQVLKNAATFWPKAPENDQTWPKMWPMSAQYEPKWPKIWPKFAPNDPKWPKTGENTTFGLNFRSRKLLGFDEYFADPKENEIDDDDDDDDGSCGRTKSGNGYDGQECSEEKQETEEEEEEEFELVTSL